MVRFAYSDDDDVLELAAAFPRTSEEVRPSVLAVPEPVAKPAPAAVAPAVEQPLAKPTPVQRAPRSQVEGREVGDTTTLADTAVMSVISAQVK